MEELQCHVCISAQPGFSGISCGKQRERSRSQILIFRQGGVHDISLLLSKNRPQIVVDESGG